MSPGGWPAQAGSCVEPGTALAPAACRVAGAAQGRADWCSMAWLGPLDRMRRASALPAFPLRLGACCSRSRWCRAGAVGAQLGARPQPSWHPGALACPTPSPPLTHTHTCRCGDCDLFRQLGMPSIGRERQTESGIILVDRRRHWLVLEWALWLNTNDHITYKLACEGRLVAVGRGERAAQELLPPGRACRHLALAGNKSAAARSTLLATCVPHS